MSDHQPLIDSFGRRHNNLRVSVTDRCNIRCRYCMPSELVQFRPQVDLLSFEEITRFVDVASTLGIDRVRLTGGEPLVRADLPELVRQLANLPGIRDLALTTNAILLAPLATSLREAGLGRLNISLDAVNKEDFLAMARRNGLQQTIDGIDAAIDAGFDKIRVNAIALRGFTERQIPSLVQFAAQRQIELRFIEFMPLDAEQGWTAREVLSCAEIRAIVERKFGTMRPIPRNDHSQPAVDFELPNGARIGMIAPVTNPFCGECNRLRITAEGQIRNCLFSTEEWNARDLMRSGGSDDELRATIRECLAEKWAGHGIDSPDFQRPARAMYQIGG